MMDKLKKAFGYSDPLAQSQIDTQAYLDVMKMHQQNMMQAQNAARNLGAQNMAGGAGPMGHGMAATQLGQMGAYATWGQQLSPTQIRDKTRSHIANEVEKMAEEIGAPTLLHAVVLAIRTMEIPE